MLSDRSERVAWYGRLFRGVTRRWRREGASLLSICYRLMEDNESATPTSKLPQAVTTCSSSLDRRGALAVMLVRLAAMSLVVCARPVPSRTLPLMRGGEVTKSPDLDCVRVVRSESDLDELVAESGSLLVVLRCRGDGHACCSGMTAIAHHSRWTACWCRVKQARARLLP